MERIRCDKHDKVCYVDEDDAIRSAAIQLETKGRRLGWYYKPSCGYWHLTRQIQRSEKNRRYFSGKVIELRDYQQAAIEFLYKYFREKSGNPIIALPTGTGKSIVIAEFVRTALKLYPGTRILMLTHVKELIEQNMKNLLAVWPTAPAGIYSAGLKRKEAFAPITFGGIQSAVRNVEAFGRIDLMLIDECHLVSPKNGTSYMKMIELLQEKNPHIKAIGFSATPYRLGQGMLTDGGIFTDICFDLTERESFNWLVHKGWISPLIPRKTQTALDASEVRVQGGEYVQSELQIAVDKEPLTYAAVRETLNLAGSRSHLLVFATGIQHSEHVAEVFQSFDVPAAAVHSELTTQERDDRIRAFKSGELRVLVNNNILTTGFDYPAIDCIVVLRPTASPVLWVQMLGRGTRPYEGKANCLVLDFAGNTARLGPINDPVIPRRKGKGPPGIAPVRLCDHCGCYSHASSRFCQNPECGIEFPKNLKISVEASTAQLIAGLEAPKIEQFQVSHIVYRTHQKEGKPDSMRVDYHCGLRRFSEFICIQHGGYPSHLAKQWWQLRSQWGAPPSTSDGMKATAYLRSPKSISVIDGKIPRIVGYTFED